MSIIRDTAKSAGEVAVRVWGNELIAIPGSVVGSLAVGVGSFEAFGGYPSNGGPPSIVGLLFSLAAVTATHVIGINAHVRAAEALEARRRTQSQAAPANG